MMHDGTNLTCATAIGACKTDVTGIFFLQIPLDSCVWMSGQYPKNVVLSFHVAEQTTGGVGY